MIIVPFAVYDSTGRILFSGKTPPDNVALQADPENGLEVLVGDYKQGTHYVVDGVALLRPEMGCVVNGTVIENLPVPCTVEINGGSYEVPDGTLELTFELPGDYPFTVTAFPYLDFKGVINAT